QSRASGSLGSSRSHISDDLRCVGPASTWPHGRPASFPLSLPIDHALGALRVTSAVQFNLRSNLIDFAKIIRREPDVCSAQVLLQPLQLSRARNRYHVWLLG